MSLVAARKDGPPRQSIKGPPCSIGALIHGGLPGQESDALLGMLTDRMWEGSAIARALLEHAGHKTTTQTVNRHRRGECSCEPV